MRLPLRARLSSTALAAVLATTTGGCGCFMGRSYDPQSWRELVAVDRAAAPFHVESGGFYGAAACALACPTFGDQTVERCYPVAVSVPVLPERIVACHYMVENGVYDRHAVPRIAAEGDCARLCQKGRLLHSCEFEPDLPPSPDDKAFVVCAYHKPGGCDMSFSMAPPLCRGG